MQPNIEHINRLLSDPAALADIDIVDLQFWAIQYPQVPLFRAWLARKAKTEAHESWQQYRMEAAATALNRTLLYHYLESPATSTATPTVAAPAPVVPDTAIEEETPPNAEAAPVETSAADSLLQTLQVGTTEEAEVENVTTETVQEIPSIEETTPPTILPGEENESEVFDLTGKKEPLRPPAEGLHSFIEWLDLLEQKPTEKLPVTEQEWIEQPAVDFFRGVSDEVPDTLPVSEVPAPVSEEEDEPVAEPEGEEEIAVALQAQLSLQFSEDLMTETLAKLYAQQGKTAKAIKIYKALALHNPEKSSYFAALIQQLEDN